MARREQFDSVADWLWHLAENVADFESVYQADPNIVTLRDEHGKTILHHAARAAIVDAASYLDAEKHSDKVVERLLRIPEVNFQAVDNDGNTFLHMTVDMLDYRNVLRFLGEWTKIAAQKNFNFNAVNHAGKNIFWGIVMSLQNTAYAHLAFPEFLRAIKAGGGKIDIYSLDDDGRSALWHAVNNRNHFDSSNNKDAAIDALLKAGIFPTARGTPGDPQNDPFALIEVKIQNLTTSVSALEAKCAALEEVTRDHTMSQSRYRQLVLGIMDEHEREGLLHHHFTESEQNQLLEQYPKILAQELVAMKESLGEIKAIKAKMEECLIAEIRKNARILGQAARGSASLFAKKGVPRDVLAKIAADTTKTSGQTDAQREKLAQTHLDRPPIKK